VHASASAFHVPEHCSELNFSLSAVTLKQFKSVTIEANSRLQVFVHYVPVARPQTR
jgi:hypothetical protein